MKRSTPLIVATALALAALTQANAAPEHKILVSSGALQWGTAPAILPPGAQFAVVDGDPTAAGPVTVRMSLPAGYKIPPHWHPTDERVTVLSGVLAIGMGDTLDLAKATTLKSGGFAVAPAKMHHFAWTKRGAVIQVDLMGPFAMTYVNPADDPSHAAR